MQYCFGRDEDPHAAPRVDSRGGPILTSFADQPGQSPHDSPRGGTMMSRASSRHSHGVSLHSIDLIPDSLHLDNFNLIKRIQHCEESVDKNSKEIVGFAKLGQELTKKIEQLEKQLTGEHKEVHHSDASHRELVSEVGNLKKTVNDQADRTKEKLHQYKERLQAHMEHSQETTTTFHNLFAEFSDGMQQIKSSVEQLKISQANMCSCVVPSSLLEETVGNGEKNFEGVKSIGSVRSSTKRSQVATLDHLAERYVEYELGFSTWDVGCFMFVRCLGPGGSLQKLVLLIFTVLFQLCFCIICNINFTQTVFTDDMVDAMRSFRLNVAHDHRYTNSVTRQTFATRLCERSLGLELGTSQLLTLENIDGYLGQDGAGMWETVFAGTFMSCLALFCWSMTVFTELRVILNFWSALHWLPREPTVVIALHEHFEITSLSWHRLFCSTMVLSVRAFLACFLLYLGGMFLATESNVTSLLLNTIALEFVVHVDKLVFQCFAADTSISFVKRMRPLKVHPWKTAIGVDSKSIGLLLLSIAYTLIFYFVVVVPMTDNMTEVIRVLCKDTLEFAYAPDAYGFIYLDAYAAEASPYAALSTKSINQAIHTSVTVLNDRGNEFEFATNPVNLGYTLSEMNSMGADQLVDLYNGACQDLIGYSSVFDFRAYVRITIDPLINTCSDLAHACYLNTRVGNVARWVCPITCTCDSPFSATYSSLSRAGCPTACTKTDNYKVSVSTAACKDWTLTELEATHFWKNWTHYLKSNAHTRRFGEALTLFGCSALSGPNEMNRSAEFCDATYLAPFATRALAPVCPIACQCNGSFTELNITKLAEICPGTCPVIQSLQNTVV